MRERTRERLRELTDEEGNAVKRIAVNLGPEKVRRALREVEQSQDKWDTCPLALAWGEPGELREILYHFGNDESWSWVNLAADLLEIHPADCHLFIQLWDDKETRPYVRDQLRRYA